MAVIISALMRFVNLEDIPTKRSSHVVGTPKGGGVAFVIPSFIFFCLLSTHKPFVFFAFLPVFVIAILGAIDDKHELGWKLRFFIQTFMALISAIVVVKWNEGLVIQDQMYSSLQQGLFVILGTFWVVSIINIYNFMDGMDGLAALEGIVVSIFTIWFGFYLGDIVLYGFSYYLLFGLIGFLVFNFPKAKLFMGDVGSQFQGFIFALLGLYIAVIDWDHFFVMPLLTFNFIFDGFITIIRRYKRGENIFMAHKEHLYQILHQSGWKHWEVSILNALFCIFQGSLLAFNEIYWHAHNWQGLILFVPALLVQCFYAWCVTKRRRVSYE